MNKLKWWYILIAVITITTCTLVHQKKGYFNWQSEIWTDQAGYYAYNPYFFIYDLDASAFPERIDERTGIGFRVVEGKMKTKYTSGVAALQLPFFILVDIYVQLSGGVRDGFSGAYHKVINFSALFYFLAALYLLIPVLRHYFTERNSIIYLVLLTFGTNVFYYTVAQNGMSHIYSFFLFIAFWRIVHELFIFKHKKNYLFFLLALTFGLIILIRPINLLILLLLFWNISSKADLLARLKYCLAPKRIIPAVLIIGLTLLPQFLYWHSISGEWINYSYGEEGFIYKYNPQLLAFWFAPKNGMFPYTPLLLLAVIFLIYYSVKGRINAIIGLVFFLLISYISASWHQYYFGCGFGARNMVEYAPFLVFPLVQFIHHVKPKILRFTYPLLGLFTLACLTTMYNYNYCFGGDRWDWKYYLSYYQLRSQHEAITFEEPVEILPGAFSKALELKGRNNSLVDDQICSIWAEIKSKHALTESTLVFSSSNDSGKVVMWSGFPLKDQFSTPNTYQNYYINIGKSNEELNGQHLQCYLWNQGSDTLYLKSLRLKID
ncbi:hypothetical protein SAMN05216474_1384 [Lishizhenia tianjinensis]|uniref:Dolichyl-phosphate-mannose-protein mannosyltransferase n=1 Tax=Lishizhenia tianjinensis TaxID=477690 RepID=A0A1I6ZIG1_9FLAO|nr:hypothetical protein [Lishizhenia tianjinensis]SFT62413.1 hypothetical protein SAMN05216474_1384 [Lishizhenia tianjinensis]